MSGRGPRPGTARIAWLLVALAGCGDNLEPPADGIRSGSRLRARFLANADGARQFESFYDRELAADCSFQGDPPRCLPEVAYARSYIDAGCTVPLFGRGVAGECTTPPSYLAVALATQCPDEEGFQRIWKRGPRVTPDVVYVLEAGACVAQAARTDYDYYAADVELPVERFVAATFEVVGEGRLRELALVGEDGSRQPVGFHDETFDAPCGYDESTGRCAPDFVRVDLWRDNRCSYPLAAALRSECGRVPRFVGWYAPDGAESSLALFEPGPEFTPAVVYSTAGTDSCRTRIADPESYAYYLVGDDVGGELAELHRVAGDDRRLQAYYLVDDAGARQRADGLHDRERDIDCEPVQTGPDRWHCVPGFGLTPTRLFADPLCEREIDVLERRPDDPEGETTKPRRAIVWRPSGDDACESHAHLHEQGDELASGSLYVPRLLGCSRLTWDPAEVRRFALGPEIGFDDYVPLRRYTE
jgi:hypothetical protein